MRVVVKALMVSPVHWPPFKTPEAGTLLKPQRDRDQNTETQGQRGKKKETSQRELLLQSPTGVFGNTLRSSACKSAATESELQNFFFHTHILNLSETKRTTAKFIVLL
jgi:hypothetical protein